MSLQGLNITIKALENRDVALPPPIWTANFRTSPVLSLDLGQDGLSANFVREVLTCPRALRKLRCAVPWRDDDSSTPPFEHILEPVKYSLTELVLAPCCDHLLSRMDLGDFKF